MIRLFYFEKTANSVHLNRDALRQLKRGKQLIKLNSLKRLDLQNELNTAVMLNKDIIKTVLLNGKLHKEQ